MKELDLLFDTEESRKKAIKKPGLIFPNSLVFQEMLS